MDNCSPRGNRTNGRNAALAIASVAIGGPFASCFELPFREYRREEDREKGLA